MLRTETTLEELQREKQENKKIFQVITEYQSGSLIEKGGGGNAGGYASFPERWLSISEPVLLLPKIQVQFPAATLGGSQQLQEI